MRTTVLYYLFGVTKAKTARAILFSETATGRQAWIPLSVAHVKYTGRDYKVKVSVPDWFMNKINWSAGLQLESQ